MRVKNLRATNVWKNVIYNEKFILKKNTKNQMKIKREYKKVHDNAIK